MTRSNNTVKVHILEKEYQIACPPEERDAVLSSARRLDERMQELRDSRAVLGLERIAVMAALSLTNELQQQELRADALARSDSKMQCSIAHVVLLPIEPVTPIIRPGHRSMNMPISVVQAIPRFSAACTNALLVRSTAGLTTSKSAPSRSATSCEPNR